MDAEIATPEPRRWKAERDWREPSQTIHLTMDYDDRMVVLFDGKGSMPGARALIELVESARAEYGNVIVSVLVDMRKLDGAPLRAQFLLGKWLITRKHDFTKIAVFGGRPFEMSVAKAVMTIAGVGKKAWFGNHLEDAVRFLGWPIDRYPS